MKEDVEDDDGRAKLRFQLVGLGGGGIDFKREESIKSINEVYVINHFG